MRTRATNAGLTVQAIAGTYVVLFGMDVDDAETAGLRGFAIERTDNTENEKYFLRNFLCFEANEATPSDAKTKQDPVYTSLENPFQGFLWGDYTCKPDHDYTYVIHAMYGSAKNLVDRKQVTLQVQTSRPAGEKHAVYFNRGAAASQAYAVKFKNARPDDVPNNAALDWLSRGLFEALTGFIGEALDGSYQLRAAVYEFTDEKVLAAFKAASERGADVKIVFDDVPGKETGPPNEAAIAAAGIGDLTIPRRNTRYIAHDKFMVLSKGGKPYKVWTGSTNMTEGGIFGHSNVGHSILDDDLAAKYRAFWDTLSEDPDKDTLKPWNEANSPLPGPDTPLAPVFSPRESTAALDLYVERFGGATRAAFLTAPFGVNKDLQAVLDESKPVLRYIIEDTRRNGVAITNRDSNNRIAVGAEIPKGGFAQWLQEKLSGLNAHAMYIHTKYMILDPLSDTGTVITGSANFSTASITSNDENSIVVVGEEYVNDVYLTEFMRLFTHFAFRAAQTKQTDKSAEAHGAIPDVIYLQDSDAWFERFYADGTPESLERKYFSGS